MRIRSQYELPFVEIVLVHKDQSLHSEKFLLDTGSASTLISTEIALQLGLDPEPNDVIREIRGVGGSEYVYEKYIEEIQFGLKYIKNFKLQVGAMDYGFDIDGIIGYNLLTASKVRIDLEKMLIE